MERNRIRENLHKTGSFSANEPAGAFELNSERIEKILKEKFSLKQSLQESEIAIVDDDPIQTYEIKEDINDFKVAKSPEPPRILKPASRNLPNSFERIESKFLVPKTYFDQLIKTLRSHLIPSYPVEGTRFTEVESIYLDSPKLDFFHDHFMKKNPRYKVRVRRYAPNGKWSPENPSFLEFKCKEGEVTKKDRFWIANRERVKLVMGAEFTVSKELRALNKNLSYDQLFEHVSLINDLMKSHSLVPQVRNVYRREAFESIEARVTVDSNIRYHSLSELSEDIAHFMMHEEFWPNASRLAKKFDNDRFVIVEVKHEGVIPAWFLRFMDTVHVAETSFSKYCWSISQHIGAYNEGADVGHG